MNDTEELKRLIQEGIDSGEPRKLTRESLLLKVALSRMSKDDIVACCEEAIEDAFHDLCDVEIFSRDYLLGCNYHSMGDFDVTPTLFGEFEIVVHGIGITAYKDEFGNLEYQEDIKDPILIKPIQDYLNGSDFQRLLKERILDFGKD